jgi:hypothetical protein
MYDYYSTTLWLLFWGSLTPGLCPGRCIFNPARVEFHIDHVMVEYSRKEFYLKKNCGVVQYKKSKFRPNGKFVRLFCQKLDS